MISMINRSDLSFKTITADNGTEFHQYKKVETACDVKFYFATPFLVTMKQRKCKRTDSPVLAKN
ncbi:MAG: IS30 family transposase [Oleiphilaceae bacterium]